MTHIPHDNFYWKLYLALPWLLEKKIRCLVQSGRAEKALKEDVLETIEEASKDEVVRLRRHVEVHKMNENDGKIEEMVL